MKIGGLPYSLPSLATIHHYIGSYSAKLSKLCAGIRASCRGVWMDCIPHRAKKSMAEPIKSTNKTMHLCSQDSMIRNRNKFLNLSWPLNLMPEVGVLLNQQAVKALIEKEFAEQLPGMRFIAVTKCNQTNGYVLRFSNGNPKTSNEIALDGALLSKLQLRCVTTSDSSC